MKTPYVSGGTKEILFRVTPDDVHAAYYKALSLQYREVIRGQNKGIRRLRAKLKRVESEHFSHKSFYEQAKIIDNVIGD